MELMDDVESVLDRKGHQVWFVGPDTTVFDAIRWMAVKNVGALLVMEGGELLGLISERDYTRKVILKDRSSKDTRVREIMTTDLVVVQPDTSVEDAMRIMTKNRVRHLPIVDRGHVVGLVSIGDLVERTIATQRIVMEQLEGYIVGRYPG
ncbi:MAG TPA: CBS domain-containing protein [Polyangiaceae bacterium]|jgi:CBS domain-containing protein